MTSGGSYEHFLKVKSGKKEVETRLGISSINLTKIFIVKRPEPNTTKNSPLKHIGSPSLAVGLGVRTAARGRLELVADSRAGGDRGGSRRALKKYCQVWIVIWTQSDVLRAHCETRRSRSKQRVRLA